MKRVVQFLFVTLAIVIIGGVLLTVAGVASLFDPGEERLSKNSVLVLDLEGVIGDKEHDILENLRKYRKDERIKGVLLRVNSPGGVVGPSQELYDEIKLTREKYKKPVVAYCLSVAASGAYYASVAADKIVTTPGCMMGSIGALMQFVNLAKLYDWAKVERYAITTGQYKDAGAEYKPLTQEQRALFQDMLSDILAQFKAAVAAGRKMKMDHLDKYADGRVFTGNQAVKLGFADQLGSYQDARKVIGELVGLGEEPEMFKPHKKRGVMEFFEEASSESRFSGTVSKVLQTELNAKPLLLLPGAIQF